MKRLLCLAIACLMAVVFAMAGKASAVTLDGSIAGDGYSTRALQTIQTGFGGGFNELAGGYVKIEGGTLNLAITGKIEAFNKLMLFIDTGAGGENVLTKSVGSGGNNVGSDGWADKMDGFTFDVGVSPNYLLLSRAGNGNTFDFNFSTVGSTTVDEASFNIFSGSESGVNASVGPSAIGIGYNNSLVGGSIGGTAGDPAISPGAITSGLEFAIPLSAIGNPNPADIKVTAFLNNGNFDFAANQTLGGLPLGFGNLGGDGNGGTRQINLSSYDGEQFFAVIPEPTSLVLIGLSLVGLACGRTKRG